MIKLHCQHLALSGPRGGKLRVSSATFPLTSATWYTALFSHLRELITNSAREAGKANNLRRGCYKTTPRWLRWTMRARSQQDAQVKGQRLQMWALLRIRPTNFQISKNFFYWQLVLNILLAFEHKFSFFWNIFLLNKHCSQAIGFIAPCKINTIWQHSLSSTFRLIIACWL